MFEYSNTIDEFGTVFTEKSKNALDSITGDAEEIGRLRAEITNVKKHVEDVSEYLFKVDEEDPGVKLKVESLIDDFNEKHTALVDYYEETLVGSSSDPSIKDQILQAKEAIDGEHVSIKDLLSSASERISNLGEFYVKIFGTVDEENVKQGGLENELKGRMSALILFEMEQKTKYEALNAEIEGLIHGATNVGLAGAYHEMKMSFDDPIKKASWLFYGSLFLLISLSLLFSVDTTGEAGWTIVKPGDWSLVLKGLVSKLPFYAPLLWLALYATKRRSENQRLQQEYAHKEALAKSYKSYKEQIIALGDEDSSMQKDLIIKTISAIAYNASTTLDGEHGDNMPAQEVIEKAVALALKNSPVG